jgi:hypothetical protein
MHLPQLLRIGYLQLQRFKARRQRIVDRNA